MSDRPQQYPSIDLSLPDAKRTIVRTGYRLAYVTSMRNGVTPDSQSLYPLANRLSSIQACAYNYAYAALEQAEWVELQGHIADLAVNEATQAEWRWQIGDLACFALSDYLLANPGAGDPHLHELMLFLREGAETGSPVTYRGTGVSIYDTAAFWVENAGELDTLVAHVLTIESRNRPPH